MTEELFREDAYARSCEATVTSVNERGGIVLDRTVFYPTGGGQPGDCGVLRLGDGGEIEIATTVKGEAPGEIVHVPAEGQSLPDAGITVTAEIDWERRHRLMRIHTCLHLLSAVLPYPVTGGQISDGKGRLDFDLPEMTMTKEEITERLNALVQEGHEVTPTWISDDDLTAQPDLVKTMAVKPPMGQGRVRLIEVAGCDLQPCGGTHVRNTAEIGGVMVRKIEKKGRQNRRVQIVFADE
ncbi:MAG: alanyl-tRNA editing protein [Alphaproteobacteria bacterium]|nr:alanyl-tRNA editing protein [Alphaproteobacteria bacterium]